MKSHSERAPTTAIPARTVVLPRPKRIGLIRTLLLLAMSAAAAHAVNPLTLDITLKSIDSSQPPRMVADELVLSLKPSRPAQFVAVRFAHESWKILHPYELNDKGVFVLDYPVPEGVREIRYRIVVDGLWMTDPANPRTDMDETGVGFSVFTLESEPVRTILNPKSQQGGSLTFVFSGSPGRRVALVGDFNNWDPFMDPLDETSPGSYSITLRVPPGEHWYYFFTDGRRILDRYNSMRGVDPDGMTVSYFISPQP
jgi:hypothetical protein